jgi:aerobic-type carbon monoxide dehydrogenase small subunit (CoxS/CutS family)
VIDARASTPVTIGLVVNDVEHELDVDVGRTLAELLRDDLALTGTKVACGEGTCGSCTVLLDDRPVLACLTLAATCSNARVRTVEWQGELLDSLRRAFVRHDAFQCGFCTAGQLMSALALLERAPQPEPALVRRVMSGNLCRCGAYPGIERALLDVGAEH